MSIFTCTAMMLLSVGSGCGSVYSDQILDSEKTSLLSVSSQEKDEATKALEKLKGVQTFSDLMQKRVQSRQSEIAKISSESGVFYNKVVKKLHDEVQALKRENLKNNYSSWSEYISKKKEYETRLSVYEAHVQKEQVAWKALANDFEVSKVSKTLLLGEMNKIFDIIKTRISSYEAKISDATSSISDFYNSEVKKMHDKLEELKFDLRQNEYDRWNEYVGEKSEYHTMVVEHDGLIKEITEARKELANHYLGQRILEDAILAAKNK